MKNSFVSLVAVVAVVAVWIVLKAVLKAVLACTGSKQTRLGEKVKIEDEDKEESQEQCDQIGRFIGLWASF